MWVHALDLLLNKLKSQGLVFADVVGVSGSGQQHGSVYWAPRGNADLAHMDAALPLRDCLASAFQIADSPIWADSTTRGQCRRLEYHAGGPLAVAQITGSR
jgi:xylulokinase